MRATVALCFAFAAGALATSGAAESPAAASLVSAGRPVSMTAAASPGASAISSPPVSAMTAASPVSTMSASPSNPASATAPAPAEASESAIAAALDPAVNAVLRAGHVPGIAIAIEHDHRIVFERGYGLADVAHGVAVTPDTHFEIGSVTKQFTAACILQLAEAGKLSLDDHLGQYVSDYFIGRGVTIRQLLAQQSGIPEYLSGPDVVSAAGTRPATYATLLARVSAEPLEFAPGTRWKYSNTNYVLLGRIVEIVSKQSYDEYVRAHLFGPAGMTQSGFIHEESALMPMARGYEGAAKGAAPAPPLREDWAESAGDIVSTVGDLLKWDDALSAGTIVSPADLALMRSAAPLAGGGASSYGFGWFVDTLDGHARVWHGGRTFGFYALNETFPSDGETIVALTNSTVPAADALVADAFAATHADVVAPSAIVTPAPGEVAAVTARVRDTLRAFETGDIDRSQMDATMSAALTPELLATTKEQFASLGMPTALVFRGSKVEGAVTVYTYRATFAAVSLNIIMALDPDGKIAGYVLRPL